MGEQQQALFRVDRDIRVQQQGGAIEGVQQEGSHSAALQVPIYQPRAPILALSAAAAAVYYLLSGGG